MDDKRDVRSKILDQFDWGTLRSAFDQSARPNQRQTGTNATQLGQDRDEDPRAAQDRRKEETPLMAYPSNDVLSRNHSTCDRRSHHDRSSKNDVDGIATLMAATVASILLGSLIARIWIGS